MEHLSEAVTIDVFPIALPLPPFYRDHHLRNRPVLSAVEAMEGLASDLSRRFSNYDHQQLTDIRFNKFLFLDLPDPVQAVSRVEKKRDGCIRAALTTRMQTPGGKITRNLEHVSFTIGCELPARNETYRKATGALSGVRTRVAPDRIYRELVPFGPAYRNIKQPLLLSQNGAMATVGSPDPPESGRNLFLGSPYVLDAAFHAACVWCQRFFGIVAFPVSIDRRSVIQPTRLDDSYPVRVVPIKAKDGLFVFDIFIRDNEGGLREIVTGVHMQDVSGGRQKPPKGFYHPLSIN